MRRIPQLQKGDKVAIISTARKISTQELEPAIRILKEWGLTVELGNSINAEDHQFAGDDLTRLKDFNYYLQDDSCKAILCARGGYGSVRIVDDIDWEQLTKTPKWVIGYSDVTTIHAHLIKHTDLYSVHGTMPINFPETGNNEATETLRKVLFGESTSYQFEGNEFNRNGEVDAKLVGGNLSIVYSLLGSPSSFKTEGRILFLEDLDEYLYHIDRMMQNLKRNGLLENLAGLVIGGMTDMNDNTIPFGKTAIEIINEYVKDYDYPVAFNAPIGHIDNNLAVLEGGYYQLKVNGNSAELNLLL